MILYHLQGNGRSKRSLHELIFDLQRQLLHILRCKKYKKEAMKVQRGLLGMWESRGKKEWQAMSRTVVRHMHV